MSFLNSERGSLTRTLHRDEGILKWLLTVIIRQQQFSRLLLGFSCKMTHDPGMPKRGRSYVNQSISFPPLLLSEARARAQRLGLPFSAYVQKCLERDLAERGAITFSEPGLGAQVAAEPPQAEPVPSRQRKPRK